MMHLSFVSLAAISFSVLPSTWSLPQSSHRCVAPRVRKEWRTLSEFEQADFVQATNCLSKLPHDPKLIRSQPLSGVVPEINNNSSAYDDFVYLHIDLNTKFHFTGLFFPWHRWYVHTYEKALSERCGFRGTIPYWDWTKDVADGMQNMTILSDDLINGLGSWGDVSNDNQITTGGFKNLRVAYPVPHNIRRLYTNQPYVNKTLSPLFPDPFGLANDTLTQTKVDEALACGEGDITCLQMHVEGNQHLHGGAHSILGGDMHGQCPGNAPSTCVSGPQFTPNDPVFWLHHVRLDKIWSEWQAQSPVNAAAVGGGTVQDETQYTTYPTGLPPYVTPDTTLPTDGLFLPAWKVENVMDIQGESLCYRYE